MRSRAYEAWRESEAYAVPMTPAGVEAANTLKEKHEEQTTELHNYYLVSSILVRELYKDDYALR